MEPKYTQKELDRRAKVIERIFKINRKIELLKDQVVHIILKETQKREISYSTFEYEYGKATAGRY